MRRPWMLGVGLVLFVLFAAMGLLYWSARDTTLYAAGFSEEAFGRVTVGASVATVYSLVGEPLLVRPEWSPTRWCYEGSPASRGPGGEHVVANIFTPPACVLFDERNLVSGVTGNPGVVAPGLTTEAVRALLGEPSEVYPAVAKTLHYTAPGGDGLFRARVVALSEDDHVAEIVTYQFYD